MWNNLIQLLGVTEFWVGIKRSDSGAWETIDGGEVNLDFLDPSAGDCVSVIKTGEELPQMEAADCKLQKTVVCEKP